MSSRLIAAASRDQLELSEDELRVFAMTRIEPSERVNGLKINIFELSTYLIGNCGSMIRDITGISVRYEWIPPEDVQKMYKSLEDFNPGQAVQKFADWNCSYKDFIELRKFLKACSECKLGLYNPPIDLW